MRRLLRSAGLFALPAFLQPFLNRNNACRRTSVMNAGCPPPHEEPFDEFELENLIRERAYDLWQAAGAPPNGSMEFWLQARQMVEAERSQNAVLEPDDLNVSNDK